MSLSSLAGQLGERCVGNAAERSFPPAPPSWAREAKKPTSCLVEDGEMDPFVAGLAKDPVGIDKWLTWL